MKKCPYCAEEIKAGTMVCPHCGHNLVKPRSSSHSTMQGLKARLARWSKILGIPGLIFGVVLLCFLLVVATVPFLDSTEEMKPTATVEVFSSVVISTFTPGGFTAVPTTENTPGPASDMAVTIESSEATQTLTSGPDGSCETCTLECPGTQDGTNFCIANPALVADPALFEKTLIEFCDSRGTTFCQMLVWTDPGYVPSAFPVSDLQESKEVADYIQNEATGYECLRLMTAGAVTYSSEGCK